MAYRRKQGGLSRSSTFKEEIRRPADLDIIMSSSSSTAPSSPLARRTNYANSPSQSQSQAARLDSFLSSGALHSSLKDRSKGSATYDYTSMRSTNEPGGFWGVLARKAKSILDDRPQPNSPTSPKPEKPVTTATTFSTSNHQHHQYESYSNKVDSPTSRNGVDRSLITSSSLNHIGDTIGNALEEVSKKSEDYMMKETISADNKWRRSVWDDEEKDYAEPNKETTQLKATRHVAIATADKAKQLLRQLKSVKADLAVAKERCCQLEEENKILREKGDDDLIRDQLETLLAEKGVLAHENSVYARENRYLREIVEFHHLSMQDHMLMYLDQDDNDLLSSFNHHDNMHQSHHVSD
ncbi:hypothetical protein L6452_41831 [Arctium lappa]|uniref:Uncharacterized protein n=1 Tax=Arctium lappa TaxID=4217 RepID=A0ACB8XH97_ARCLA|nr:hypothetical protein L6452_41831 [Arctium lappa]